MTWQKMFCVVFVFTCTLASRVWAQTTVGGFINSDTHWMAGNGPFIVDQSILVTNDATLTIDPGVEVRFKPDRGIVVDSGQLIARGTEVSKITFTADVADVNAITTDDRWGFIRFADREFNATFDAGGNYVSGSILEHAIVEGAGGVNGGAIDLAGTSPFISHSLIRNNSDHGIFIRGSSGVRIIGNTITENSIGIRMDTRFGHSFNVFIFDNTVHANDQGIFIGNERVGNTRDVEIVGNTVTENRGEGIILEGSRGALIKKNTVRGNRLGVEIERSENVVLTGNTVSGNRLGMEIENSQDVVLTRNTITENTSGSPDEAAGLLLLSPGSAGEPLTLHGDVIANNNGIGLVVAGGGDNNSLVISGDSDRPTQIFGNTGFQFVNDSSFRGASLGDDGNVNARNVFWGTTDIDEVEDGISDFFDDVSKGIVFFDPIAVPEPTTAAMLALLGAAVFRRRRVA